MIKRIVEISNPAYLHLRNRQMVIEREDAVVGTVPVEDLGMLILDHSGITHTQALLTACSENNVVVLVCDSKHLPSAILLPLDGHTLHSKTLGQQIAATEPTCKRLWQHVVQAKIREQAKVLHSATGNDTPLRAYAAKVKSGDPENIEAQAARIYWQRLFGPEFRRNSDTPGINAMLNYGYAVMRGAVARAVVGAGLHPALGVHHRNQYNSFALADDLMEPLRPLVDIKVYEVCELLSDTPKLTSENKRALLEILGWDCTIGERKFPLMIALHQYAASVRRMLAGEQKEVEIPVL
jgi:CRISPR-associated protein Cas1